jgi:hypothetical protein
MTKPVAALLAATMVACSQPIEDQVREIDIEIASAGQEILSLQADGKRWRTERAATGQRYADQPDLMRQIQVVMNDTDRQMESVHANLIASLRQTILALEARRRAITGQP